MKKDEATGIVEEYEEADIPSGLDATQRAAAWALLALVEDQREEVLRLFCKGCAVLLGGDTCYCQHDE